MGINPTRGLLPTITPETPQARYGDIFTDAKSDGEVASEELAGIKATAQSAGTGASELAEDLTDLESRLAAAEQLLKNAIIAVPPANLADLETGQVYMDVPTLTIHTK